MLAFSTLLTGICQNSLDLISSRSDARWPSGFKHDNFMHGNSKRLNPGTFKI